MLKPLSLTAYAKHRREKGLVGGSLKAVQRAVKAERITTDPDGKIPDAEVADREWADKTDHSRVPIGLRIRVGEDEEDDDGDGPSLSEAAAFEKHFKAAQAELNYGKAAGELVNAEELGNEYSNRCSVVRTRMLGIPNSLKQRHPEIDRAVLATLETLIRDGLEELAGGRR